MVPSLVGLLQQNGRLLEKALGDLEPGELTRRIVVGANPLVWIAGHLTWARFGLAQALGAENVCPLPAGFGKGAVLTDDTVLPSREAVLTAWREVSALLPDRLSAATDAQLAGAAPRKLPIADESLLGMVTFLTFHEGYHIGQIALLRKAIGRPGLVDA